MKIISCEFLFLIISIRLFCACDNNPNRIYFTINTENRQILIPVYLDDSIKADLMFDTGGNRRTLILDSAFCAFHPSLSVLNNADNITPFQMGSAWTQQTLPGLFYGESKQEIKIGTNTGMTLENLIVFNWRKYMNSQNDGLFNIPLNDTIHVWEINFVNNYLEIHKADNFTTPENTFVFPLLINRDTHRFLVEFPIHVKSFDEDTLTIVRSYEIDTAAPNDITLIRPNKDEIDFFDQKKQNAVWTKGGGGYNIRHTVNAVVFGSFEIDSLRIYTLDNARRFAFNEHLIGLNFLKRFNVFFDMKNKQIGLQPIKNYRRVVNPNHKRFYYNTYTTADGKTIIKTIGDYKLNYFKAAGLQEGDEIKQINGLLIEDINMDEYIDNNQQDTLIYNVVRNGEAMRFVIPVNKNHEQGD